MKKQLADFKRDSQFSWACDYLSRLLEVTEVMSAGAPSQKQLLGILQTATEIAGAQCAWLYVSPSQLETLQLYKYKVEEAMDCQIELGPKARLVLKGPIAEEILRYKENNRPALLENSTKLMLPLPGGGILVQKPSAEASADPQLYIALSSLANMAAAVVLNASEQNEALCRAKGLERMYQQLLSKNMELRERSMIDDLTGLYNRRFFQRSLTYEIDRFSRYRHSLGVILFDVDHFKKVNDLYGHTAGDNALKHLAKVASGSIRSADLLARYGGEEFVVLLPDTDINGTTITGERLRAAVENAPFMIDHTEVRLTISAGITALDGGFKGNADQIMHSVDDVLYKAKSSGRNQVAAVRV
jgi:diguanylate cyclase (GGDEF)-like protein